MKKNRYSAENQDHVKVQNTFSQKLWLPVGILLFCAIFFNMILPASAQENNAVFRAFYVYKFALYVKYPPEAQSGDFVISVVSDEAVADVLRNTSLTKKVGERNIKVQVTQDIKLLSESHIVFVPESNIKRLKSFLQALKNKPVVVVTENANACEYSCISLTLKRGAERRFQIDRRGVESGGVKLSSDLLDIASLCN